MAAVVAAISAYIREESPLAISGREANLWGSSGRREMMGMRTLWQLRMTERSRLMQRAAFPPREGGTRYDQRA